MSNEFKFDALELARRANAEIDDMRLMAEARAEAQRPSVGSEAAVLTALIRAFRALAKGG